MLKSFFRRKEVYIPALLVIIIGAGLRLYSFYFSHLMFNIDGIYYIQQAKALYLGEFDRFMACYWYPNVYPFFIVPFYWITGHWVVAARTASFLFGTATLIPLYFLLRHFFDRPMATCVLLLAAVNPFLVATSSEVLRGPVFWFFSSLGLALFVAAFDKDKRGLFLAGSCLAFLVATWSRIDAVVYILATPCFIIVFGERQRKMRDVLGFISPLLVLGAVGLAGVVAFGDGFSRSLLPRDILSALLKSFHTYNETRDGLKVLGDTVNEVGVPPGFFIQCRNLVWWLGLGDIFMLFLGMAFLPFGLFFLFGFKNIGSRLRDDVKLRYLLVMGLAAYVLVVVQELSNWIMSPRFVVLLFLPLLVFFGSGLARFVDFLQQKFSWQRTTVLILLGCVFFLAALPKNLDHHRADKLIFREIGEFIGQQEDGGEVVTIAGFFKRVGYINLFANLEVQASPCCNDHHLPDRLHGKNLLVHLQKRDFTYFIWDEKHCTVEELQLLQQAEFIEVTSWQTKRLGRMILFKMR